MKSIVIFGGAGFVGRHIIRRLAKKGYKIIVPYQRSTNEAKLRLLGNLGQIIPYKYNNLEDRLIVNILKNIDICINMKTTWSSKKISFNKSIYKFNQQLLKILETNKKINQFIFFSGLGIDNNNKSLRIKAIYETEKYIFSNFLNSIIIRPGIIIGKNDNFLSKLIPIFKISFFIPIFGKGSSKFQPVYIDDVSLVIEKIILNELKGNHIFELTGSNIVNYKDFYSFLIKTMKKKRIFITIPMFLARILVYFAEKLFFSPINSEQLLLFESDNLKQNIDKDFSYFSIYPQDIYIIIKKILKK